MEGVPEQTTGEGVLITPETEAFNFKCECGVNHKFTVEHLLDSSIALRVASLKWKEPNE